MLREAGETVIGIDIHAADIVADLSTKQGRQNAANAAIELAKGDIDAVIACAGLSRPIAKTVSVNYFGVTEFLNTLAPTLAKAEAPRVAVTSSMSSLQPNDETLVEAMCIADDEDKAAARAQELADVGGSTGNLIYSSSKRAISRWIRREAPKPQWAGAGIPLNAVGPGTVLTPMVTDLLATEESRAMVDRYVPMPLNYHLTPENVAHLLIWLTSVENSHCCGQTIYIDGGADVVLRGDNIWDQGK